jgi:hypothetical protein
VGIRFSSQNYFKLVELKNYIGGGDFVGYYMDTSNIFKKLKMYQS